LNLAEQHFDAEVVLRLLEWWRKNKRDFPWRRTKDPYKILVAEVLLRKTDAPKVLAVYEDFLRKYPSIADLAGADESELSLLLVPLGLYNVRAKQLKKLARDIVEQFDGKIPDNPEKLKSLDGIGDYIANAIACFAYEKPLAMVDSNIARVVSRLYGIKPKSRPHLDRKIRSVAQRLVKLADAKELNLAILDFAALVCTVNRPKCPLCPLHQYCSYFRSSQ